MDAGAIARVFSTHLGVPVAVDRLHQTFPGQSQETWLVDARIGEGDASARRGYVLRVNPPGGGIVPLPLRREWEVYVRLWKTPLPVGEPLWYDEGSDFLEGRPYFVRDLVEGSADIPELATAEGGSEGLRQRVAVEHAEKLAALHTLDWSQYGFADVLDVPATTAEAPRLEFETWVSIWEQVRAQPFPLVTKAINWFEHHLPKSCPRVSLLKGNNGLGEEIWRDERIVALSDWELASLGDPAQDWAFSQGMLGLWDPEQVLAHYEEITGFEIDRESLDFWTVWTMFKALCCTTAGLRGFLDGRDQRPVLPTIGFGAVKLLEHFLGVVINMDLAQGAEMMRHMASRQMQDRIEAWAR